MFKFVEIEENSGVCMAIFHSNNDTAMYSFRRLVERLKKPINDEEVRKAYHEGLVAFFSQEYIKDIPSFVKQWSVKKKIERKRD